MNNIKNGKTEQRTEFIVAQEAQLLPFLLEKFANKSRNHTKGLLLHRQTLVDGKLVTKHDYALRIGQKVLILKDGNLQHSKKNDLKVIYEDDDIIVINKPSGLLSVATDKREDVTAYSLLTDYVRGNSPHARIFVVHRLDRDTSGIFMVAKNETIKLALQENWDKIVSYRGYIAVVEGAPKQPSGVVKSWLRETVTHLMYSSFTQDDGLLAITNYKVLRKNDEFSMLEISIQTGRKNQIRVHMKDLGCPVIGDKKYSPKGSDPLKRLGLHANRLEFTHPTNGKEMCFEVPTPGIFTNLFK